MEIVYVHDGTCKFVCLWFSSEQVGAVHKSLRRPKAFPKWPGEATDSQEIHNPKVGEPEQPLEAAQPQAGLEMV